MDQIVYTSIIPLNPRTKKNSQKICKNKHTGKRWIDQSDIYKQYELDCGFMLKKIKKPIDYPINVKAVYYRQTKHRVDLPNLNNALLDILVKYGILKDDDCKIVVSTDGSRVYFDKENPRTEIEITRINDII